MLAFWELPFQIICIDIAIFTIIEMGNGYTNTKSYTASIKTAYYV
jgi:hypothetical protein